MLRAHRTSWRSTKALLSQPASPEEAGATGSRASSRGCRCSSQAGHGAAARQLWAYPWRGARRGAAYLGAGRGRRAGSGLAGRQGARDAAAGWGGRRRVELADQQAGAAANQRRRGLGAGAAAAHAAAVRHLRAERRCVAAVCAGAPARLGDVAFSHRLFVCLFTGRKPCQVVLTMLVPGIVPEGWHL